MVNYPGAGGFGTVAKYEGVIASENNWAFVWGGEKGATFQRTLGHPTDILQTKDGNPVQIKNEKNSCKRSQHHNKSGKKSKKRL